ncbi:MAG: IS110 family transposase [Bacteroidetes bacterium]|nr:MAG: IS110 family transposase [Bacteroidota bacterium]
MQHKEDSETRYCLGIDVSMDKLSVCLMTTKGTNRIIKGTTNFTNDASGHQKLLQWTKKHVEIKNNKENSCLFLMESTGSYHEDIAWFLHLKGENVSIILANKTKHHAKSLNTKTKNDKSDSKVIADYGLVHTCPLWRPISAKIYQLRLCTRQLQDLNKMKNQIGNKIHAFQHGGYNNDSAISNYEKILTEIKASIHNLEKELLTIIENDVILKAKYDKINKIHGVNIKVFSVIIAETNGFAGFNSIKQLISYAGYDVREHQSGKFIGQRRISKRGNSRIRRILYMPAFVAVGGENNALKDLKDRIFERTKMKMKGYVAVQKKLLCLIFTLWKKDVEYDVNYQHPQSIKKEAKEVENATA